MLSEKEIEECKKILRERARRATVADRYAAMDRAQKEGLRYHPSKHDEPVQQGPVQGRNSMIPLLRASVWV
jgi:hypothetical protein